MDQFIEALRNFCADPENAKALDDPGFIEWEQEIYGTTEAVERKESA